MALFNEGTGEPSQWRARCLEPSTSMARETTEVRAAASAGLRTVARDVDCGAGLFFVPTSLAACCEFDRRLVEAIALSLALAGT